MNRSPVNLRVWEANLDGRAGHLRENLAAGELLLPHEALVELNRIGQAASATA